MNKINMKEYGLSERFINESTLYENQNIGRIASQDKSLYRLIYEKGELRAQVSGKFRYNAVDVSDYPAVGDFVMFDENESGNAIINHVLTRKSAFIRKAAGTSNNEQIVASNIDTVFICMSLNNDFNIRRLERYMGVCWDSGATPVIVLTKADLCDNYDSMMKDLDNVAMGVDIIITSSLNDDITSVKKYIEPGKTIAFIGSSGVGKTTLINKLMGEEIFDTQGLRNDDRGRHTTTSRELILLPAGGVVIDTPGMRELGLEGADLSKAFADIDELASECKFNDCTHIKEPGCAVRKAVENGDLSEDRLASYFKLNKELGYDSLNSKQIEQKKLNEMFKNVGGMKNARKHIKNKNKY